jgi:primosomal protein N''
MSKAHPRKKMRPYLKNNLKAKRAQRVAPVAEHLLSKYKALSSNSSISKRQNNRLIRKF